MDATTSAFLSGIISAIIGGVVAILTSKMSLKSSQTATVQSTQLGVVQTNNAAADQVRDDLLALIKAYEDREKILEGRVNERDKTIEILRKRIEELSIENTKQAIQILNLTYKLEQYDIRLAAIENKVENNTESK